MRLDRLMSLGLPLMLVAGLAQAQGDFDDVEVTATHVAGKVYMLMGSGGNIGVSLGEDGILIIDDQFAPLAEKIQAELDEIGGGKVAFILNTHWHGDHTGGNVEFDKLAPIIAHKNVRARLSRTLVENQSCRNSTRRFFARPSSVALSATGSNSP